MNENELLEYGLRELAAFREDKRDLMAYIGADMGEKHSPRSRAVGAAIGDVIRAGDERRNAAGLTRNEAAQACRLAAMVEKAGATMTLNLLTWLAGPMIDITPDPDTMAMLEQPAACDKHRELVNDAAIEALQEKIKARGGTVTIAQHVARLKERGG